MEFPFPMRRPHLPVNVTKKKPQALATQRLTAIVDRLLKAYGKPRPPFTTDPFELILYENVAYLVDDDFRRKAFESLRSTIGTRPVDILSASPEQFEVVAKLAGSNKRGQVAKLIAAAKIAIDEFHSDLGEVLGRPFPRARSALKKFPGIGDPGAEKILLFSKAAAVLALDSNGLRVLTRIGFAPEQSSYAATYRAVVEKASEDLPKDHDWLIAAHQLLRKHGQQICKTNLPRCHSCVVQPWCSYGQTH